MKKDEFEKEKRKRDLMKEFFSCLCGAKFLGRNKDYDKHLQFDCPIYREAFNKLSSPI